MLQFVFFIKPCSSGKMTDAWERQPFKYLPQEVGEANREMGEVDDLNLEVSKTSLFGFVVICWRLSLSCRSCL